MRIGLIGGGPSCLFMLKRILEADRTDISVTIFEKKDKLGAGMPYSPDGARGEHITNVSSNEIPNLITTVEDWLGISNGLAGGYQVSLKNFNAYKVLPRLLFGEYLTRQFEFLLTKAQRKGLMVDVRYLTNVIDITDLVETNEVQVLTETQNAFSFDKVIICSGHYWPKTYEGKIAGYFDSPYPPQKLTHLVNHPIAIRGASLTAIDALRTLALNNGSFTKVDGRKKYQLHPDCAAFKVIMHSRNGLLPAVRFHLEDSHLAKDSVLAQEEVDEVRANHAGFLPLDYIYQRNFLAGLQANRPEFYDLVKELSLEDFVELMMIRREDTPPFELLKAEYQEAESSIALKRSVYWKEMLAILSFAMNYPAKYFSAEDMLRLQKTLMPLISIVIAFAPQDSVDEIIALYDAGVLQLVSVGENSQIELNARGGITYHFTDEGGNKENRTYDTFIDCIGQPHLRYDEIPFPGLVNSNTLSPARIKFSNNRNAEKFLAEGNKNIYLDVDGHYYLNVPGITIDDHFRVVNKAGEVNSRLHIMAVPFIGGYNPDYSGLDFGEAASAKIVTKLLTICPEQKTC